MRLPVLVACLVFLSNCEDLEEEEEETSATFGDFLYKRMQDGAKSIPKKKVLPAAGYMIPGPQEPLPGRSHTGDYWPVFPFQNQYSGGLDLDPSIARHIGGDLNIAVPSWGLMDIYGRFFNRVPDTTTKFGFMNHPVNMLDLEKEDFVKLMSDPAMHANRGIHPRLPLGRLAKAYVPLNCKPPLCNPYQQSFGVGIEHDFGGQDGDEGDIDIPIPISKGVAYRFPFSGNIFYHRDNVTVTYGQNLSPIDPFASLFDYQKNRDPALAIPRRVKRSPVLLSAPGRMLQQYVTRRSPYFYMMNSPVEYHPVLHDSLQVPNVYEHIDPYSPYFDLQYEQLERQLLPSRRPYYYIPDEERTRYKRIRKNKKLKVLRKCLAM